MGNKRITFLSLTCMLLMACGVFAHSDHPRGAPAGSAANGGGKSAVDDLHFAFLSRVEGMVGGMPATGHTRYLNEHGLMQQARYSTDGTLHHLETARLPDGDAFAQVIDGIHDAGLRPAPSPDREANGDELSEYYPGHLFVRLHLPEFDVLNSYKPPERTPQLNALEQRLRKLTESAPMKAAASGIYVQAQKLSQEQSEARRADMDLSLQDIENDTSLRQVLEQEAAFVRTSDLGGSSVLGGKVVVVPNRPVYVRVDGALYLLTAYRFEADG